MGLQGVEAGRPLRSVGGQPVINLSQRFEPDPVQTTLGVDPGLHQSGAPQDPKVLGHRRLTHVQGGNEIADGSFPLDEQVQDPPAVGIRQDIEDGYHGS